MKRFFVSCAAFGLVVTVAAATADAQQAAPQNAQAAANNVLASAQYSQDPDLRCDLIEVKRVSGGALLVRWRVINTAGGGGGGLTATAAKPIHYDFSWNELFYIDPAENKRYQFLTDSGGNKILDVCMEIWRPASSGRTGPNFLHRRQVRRRSALRSPNSRRSRTCRSANEVTEMGRRLPVVGFVLIALFWTWPSAGQQSDPEAPLPPGAHGDVYTLKGEVFSLKPEAFELRGIASGLKAQAGDVQGALKDLGAKVTGREIKINLSADVLFDFDKADLRPEAGPALEKVLAVLQAYPKAAVLIEGHTDGKGNDQYNQRLSERRAESVRAWLAQHGGSAAITTRGWGRTRPIAPNTKSNGTDDPEGRQKNRRVEITVRT